MVSFDINGIIAPVFTPIGEDGSVRYDVIPSYLEHLKKNRVNAILVGGTTGEFVSLSANERTMLLDAWLEVARPAKVKVIFQVGGAPLPDVIELAKYAETAKADAIMTLPELYFKPKTADQLVRYIEAVSKAAPSLPIVYYHFPMMTGVNVNVSEFFSLAVSRIPNFIGMKADLQVAVLVADHLTDNRKVYIANHLLAPSALMGHDSSIATVSNMFPTIVQDIVTSTQAGDLQKARAQQDKLIAVVNSIYAQGDFVPAMKAAMEIVTGIKVGPPRMPQFPLEYSRRRRIEDSLRKFGFTREE